jgi:hypothetical protein
VKILKITKTGENNYLFGKTYKTQLKIVDDILCAYMVGGYIPFEDFIKLQYLTILEKEESKPFKLVVKEKQQEIGSAISSVYQIE